MRKYLTRLATSALLLAAPVSAQVSTLSNPSTNTTAVLSSINGQAITPSSVAASGTVTGSNLSGTNTGDQTTVSGQAGSVANAVTFNNGGAGAATGTTFNGSAARTISTNSIGALNTANNLSDVASIYTTAKNLQSCYVVGQSGVASSSLTGTTAETSMGTVSVPALSANDQLQIETLWSHTGTAGSFTPKVKLGASVVEGGTAVSAANLSANYYQRIANRNATNSQVMMQTSAAGNFAATSTTVTTTAEETNAGITVTFTGTLASAADSMKLESYRLELCPKA